MFISVLFSNPLCLCCSQVEMYVSSRNACIDNNDVYDFIAASSLVDAENAVVLAASVVIGAIVPTVEVLLC